MSDASAVATPGTAFQPVSGPANVIQLIGTALKKPSANLLKTVPELANLATLQVLPQPWPVYGLTADAIANGGGLETANFSGFRYLVAASGKPVVYADVRADVSGAVKINGLFTDVSGITSANLGLQQLATDARVRTGTYEPRLLSFQALHILVLWLKSNGPGSDLIYTFKNPPKDLETEKLYTAAEFLNAVRPLAKDVIATYGPPTAPAARVP